MKSPALIAAALLLTASQALGAANIAMLGQDRRASSSAFVSNAEDFDQEQFSEVAENGGPFDVSVFAEASLPTGNGDALATQISVLTTAFVHAEGAVSASGASTGESTTTYAAAQSNVALRFDITEPTTYTLSGFVEAMDNATVTVQLSRPFQTVAWTSANDEHVDVLLGGMLEADTYDLNVTCGANGASFGVGSESGLAEYSIHFAIGGATDAPLVAGAAVAAYPNPFRASTRIMVPDDARQVRIVDAAGRVVRTLRGTAQILFDGRDESGKPLASGVYWAEPVGPASRDALKLVRLR